MGGQTEVQVVEMERELFVEANVTDFCQINGQEQAVRTMQGRGTGPYEVQTVIPFGILCSTAPDKSWRGAWVHIMLGANCSRLRLAEPARP